MRGIKDEIQKKRMLVRFLDTILDESCDFNGISDRYAAQLNKIKELTATCSDELHQLFVSDRVFMVGDIILDTVGGIIGILLIYLILKKCCQEKKH